MATFTDTAGTTTYGYNADGALTSVTLPGGNCAGASPTSPPTLASRCVVYDVNLASQRLGVYWPGSINQKYTYDASGRVARIIAKSGATTMLDQTYNYGPSGATTHVIARVDAVNDRTTTYAYTNEGWLTSETYKQTSTGTQTAKYTYCYDNNGNRTVYTTSGSATCPGTANSTWDGANQQLTGPTGTAADYT